MIGGADLARHSVAAVLDGLADGVSIQDATGRLLYVNDAAAVLCGFPSAAAMLAMPLAEVRAAFEIVDLDGAPLDLSLFGHRQALAGGEASEMLVRYRRRDAGDERWWVLKSRTVAGANGGPELIVNVIRDVTQRVAQERSQAEHAARLAGLNAQLIETVDALRERTAELEQAQAALEDAERRARFLAEAGELLAASLEYESTLSAVAALAVPTFADVVSVDLLGEDGVVRRVATRATDPEVERISMTVMREHPIDLCGDSAAARVFATGEAVFLPEFDDAAMQSWARSEAHLMTMRKVGLRSTIVTPLSDESGVFGIVCFGCMAAERRFSRGDFEFACELARRMAAAIANAALYRNAETARRAAEAASRAKSQFLAVMSHELRTPLNGVIGYADLLAAGVGGALNDTQRQYVERVSHSGRHLLELVEQVLGHARADTTQELLTIDAADARSIARDAAAVIEAQVALQPVSLLLEMSDTAVAMRTDAGKVRQVLLNLLSNALKFTPAGLITLRVAAKAEAVRFDVADTGIGVAAEDIDRIFEPFTQVDQSTTRAAGGVGLGLAVSRRLATLLGGTVVCRSTPGEGSCFSLTLPRDFDAAATR